MADNKYRGNSSAYGLGSVMGLGIPGWNSFDDQFGMTNDQTSYAGGNMNVGAPTMTSSPIPEQKIANVSEPSPIQPISNQEIGVNAQTQSRQAMVQTNQVNQNQGVATTGMPYSGSTGTEYEDPYGPGSSQASFDKQLPVDEMMDYEAAMNQSGQEVQNMLDARKITGDTYSAGTHPSSGPTPQYPKNMFEATEMNAYGLGPRPESTSSPNYTYDNKGNRSEIVEPPGMISNEDLMATLAPPEDPVTQFVNPNESDVRAPASTNDPLGRLKGLWGEEKALQTLEPSALKQVGGAVKGAVKKTNEFLGKHAGAISALSTIGTGLSEMKARKGIIGDLRKGVSNVEGMLGSLANKEYQQEEAMFDEFTEGNRRIGARRNLALGETLNSVKGSNLNTGSISKIKDNIKRKFHTTTDLDLADAADAYEKRRNEYTTSSRAERAKTTEQLNQLRDQLKENERQQKLAPFSMLADVAIGVVGTANPILGMGLSAVKNKAMA